jgi:hypothetical protein
MKMQPKQKLELLEFLKKFFYGEKNFPTDVFSDVANFIKLFFSIVIAFRAIKIFVTCKSFQPSLKFVGIGGTYPSGEPFCELASTVTSKHGLKIKLALSF